MKWLLVLIILAAIVVFLPRYWPDIERAAEPMLTSIREMTQRDSPPPPPPAAATEPPRTGRVAPPGSVYMLERVTLKTANGIVAVVPGEEVRIMRTSHKGRMRITTGKHDFDVKDSQVTKDYDLAQDARSREQTLAK